AFVTVGDALVLAEHVADLAFADPDVAGRNVGVLTEVPVQLCHEALTETHDLVLAATLRVEIAPALPRSDGHAGKCVLEHLLERHALDCVERDASVEPQPALVRPQRAVELDAEAAVHLHHTLVVDPRHTEDDLPLGFTDAVDELVLEVLRVLRDQRPEGGEDLVDGLQEVAFSLVAVLDPGLDVAQGLATVSGADGEHSSSVLLPGGRGSTMAPDAYSRRDRHRVHYRQVGRPTLA